MGLHEARRERLTLVPCSSVEHVAFHRDKGPASAVKKVLAPSEQPPVAKSSCPQWREALRFTLCLDPRMFPQERGPHFQDALIGLVICLSNEMTQALESKSKCL